MSDLREQAAVLALIDKAEAPSRGRVARTEWYRIATLIEETGSALRLLKREWSGLETFETVSRDEAERLADSITSEDLYRQERLVINLTEHGIRLLTVLDDYPMNLREVYNRPPFLFVRGSLLARDNRAVAVVGTRTPTKGGLDQAEKLASELTKAGVTVLSGLARGIDTAAHSAALARGGRSLAIMGTGIDRIYPKENAELAGRIAEHGALVSQFWPGHPPTRSSFPMRNVVTSGMAIGTAVVEAGAASGAKMQARLALEHNKRLFLVKSLVLHEEWAKRYAEHPATTVVESVDDILRILAAKEQPPAQLTLS